MARKGRHGQTLARTGARTMMEVVDTQLRDDTPPETRQTLDRLLADGHTEEDARRLIACAVTSEIFDVLTHKQPYDEARYLETIEVSPCEGVTTL